MFHTHVSGHEAKSESKNPILPIHPYIRALAYATTSTRRRLRRRKLKDREESLDDVLCRLFAVCHRNSAKTLLWRNAVYSGVDSRAFFRSRKTCSAAPGKTDVYDEVGGRNSHIEVH